ncbi:peptide N-acetyl-beta-D-glucosaminyl asparaginase amidase A-domain-containing protein [Xylariomycetidae sp. FL2044]|nr:peptide N-acetyl-beta-D-glucosaminyl asparaginase amidase A-domain-containing protein [Xylariomycetidae sp. FL2044]
MAKQNLWFPLPFLPFLLLVLLASSPQQLGGFAGIGVTAHELGARDTAAAAAIHPFAKYRDLVSWDSGDDDDDDSSDGNAAAVVRSRLGDNGTVAATPLLECFQVAEPILTGPFSAGGVTPRAVEEEEGQEEPEQEQETEESCTVVLMEHTFENSYGAPFVGNYTPPPCAFDYVLLNFTTVVAGRQYDRTGVMYLGDVAIWRTTTAEPTPAGIRWTWLKDASHYAALWRRPQTLIFDLENIVNDVYTGLLNTTLTATFFLRGSNGNDNSTTTGGDDGWEDSFADLIIPLTQRLSPAPSQFVYPTTGTTTSLSSSFPRNANRAVVTVDVKGQGTEEFWWSNVPQSQVDAFAPTYGSAYPGGSAFREVQVLIDTAADSDDGEEGASYLAGVYWPYPTIFTGGVVPQLHRPIVGIDAFDLREHEIDITPFLPLLCDGSSSHSITIKIVGLVDDGGSSATLSSSTAESWYVTGKVFVWLDPDASSVTTGTLPNVLGVSSGSGSSNSSSEGQPEITLSQHLTQNATGFNETLDYSIAVSRQLSVSAVVKTAKGGEANVTWSQTLAYTNVGGVYDYGNGNINTMLITGSEGTTTSTISTTNNTNVTTTTIANARSSSHDGKAEEQLVYSTTYAYPLFCNSTATYTPEGNLTLWAQLDQGLSLSVSGRNVLPSGHETYDPRPPLSVASGGGSALDTWRNGTADYYRPADNSYSRGVGETRQVFSFDQLSEGAVDDGEIVSTRRYYRDVRAYNDTVTDDYVELG